MSGSNPALAMLPPAPSLPGPRPPGGGDPHRCGVLSSAFENAPVGMAVLTPSGAVTMCNRTMGVLLGREPAELVGTPLFEAVHPEDLPETREVHAALHGGAPGTAHHECRMVRGGGAVVWVALHAVQVPAAADRAAHLLVQVEDITARRAHEATLAHRALHDPLTGLPNRILLAERIDRAHVGRGRHARPNGLFYVDLNGFKAVNDRFGHATGDRVLQLLADRILALLRPEDTAARLGGDEFAVLCVDVEPQHCDRVADRLRAAAAEPFVVEGSAITISAAVGGGPTHTPDGVVHTAVDLLEHADRQMYAQKLSAHKPSAREPSTREPFTREPFTREPFTQEPCAQEPCAQEHR